jgi:hypothetical protein
VVTSGVDLVAPIEVVEGEAAAAPNAEANEDFPKKLVELNPSALGSFLGAPNESIGVDVGTEEKDGLGS